MTDINPLREALEAAANWHEEQVEELATAIPAVSIQWRRAEHRKQAEEIRAVLTSQPEDEAAREEAVCSCGAGHGSLEGHMDWCNYDPARTALAAAPQICPNERYNRDMATPECPLCGAFQGEDAPQLAPTDEWPAIPDTMEERAYRKGWNEGIMAGRKLTPVDDPAAPQPAPVDRAALVEMIEGAVRMNRYAADAIADTLLARGLRLAGDETMAWAVVGEDETVLADYVSARQWEAELCTAPGERVRRVAIRVVEGSDDAA